MNVIQSLVFPNFDIDAPDDLYVRPTYNCLTSRKDKTIRFLQRGAVCYFDTYFNSFTIQTWKNQTAVRRIILRLCGEGEFILKIKRHKLHSEMKHLAEYPITLTEEGIDVEFADLSEHHEGMLFFDLTLVSEQGVLTNGCYHTPLEPINPVKLGIVITHFNRKNYVLPAIERVSTQLLQDPYYQDKISLVVVDNSQNITPDEAKNAIVLPNKNLGGSGGFTRGLMYLEDDGSYTHCLFMDDDASCEVESIRRAYALLQYTTTEKFAVAGAQLSESYSRQMYEKGAVFKHNCTPLHHDVNISHIHELLSVETYSVSPNYGGWWFLCFKIHEVEKYPFPFFVRGDDLLFSLNNKLKITTLNGIGVWAEDFFVKESPLVRYLMFRGIYTCDFLSGGDLTQKILKKMFRYWYWSCVNSYNYSSSIALFLSLQDFLAGTKTFTEDMDASKARAKLAQLPQDEKMHPISRLDYDVRFVPEPSKFKRQKRKFIRKITLNYLLLPEFLMKQEYVFQPKHFGANLHQIHKYKHIYYEHEDTRTGYIATFSKKRLLQAYINYFKSLWLIHKNFDNAKAEYLSKEQELTSREFWEKIYEQKDD